MEDLEILKCLTLLKNGEYREALTAFQSVNGNDDSVKASMLVGIITCLKNLHRWNDAISVFLNDIVPLNLKINYGTIVCIGDVIYCYIKMNEIDKARKLIDTTASLIVKTYGKKSNAYGLMYMFRGHISFELKSYIKAWIQYEKARKITVKFGDSYALMILNSSEIAAYRHRFSDALETKKEYLSIISEKYGENHPKYGIALHSLASLYARLKRPERALENDKKALVIFIKKLGLEHELTVDTYTSIKKHEWAISNIAYAIDYATTKYRLCCFCEKIVLDTENILCSGCYTVQYCSFECQHSDWNEHRKFCYCEGCKTHTSKLQCCKTCKDIYYCSDACQRIDWKQHKEYCKK